MDLREQQSEKYHIQPYHMNGLNWTLVPYDPKRDNVVIVTGFMPSWWTKEYGITFGSDFHLDHQVHRNTIIKMASFLKERYADVPNFFFSPLDYTAPCVVEREYGDGFIPALFGDHVSFDDASGHPYADMLNLSDTQALALTVPDVENHPVLRSILEQRRDAGILTTGELGLEGVINIGYRLRGQEMYLDLIQKPDVIEHVFNVVYETIDRSAHLFRQWQDPMHARPTYFVNCNCLINLMSPEMYKESLLKFDMKFHESFDMFGIHTCNWIVDPYLDAIAEIGELAYLDMGEESDLDRVHKLFPNLEPTIFIHPEKLMNMSKNQIKTEIIELGKRINRGYILFCDLEVGTADDMIRAAHEAASTL